MHNVLKSLCSNIFPSLNIGCLTGVPVFTRGQTQIGSWLVGDRVSTGSDMSRYTALTLTIHVVLTLAGKQDNSDSGTAVDMSVPEISPTSSANVLSDKQRKPKFLVSGVTTTTTLSTFTICYTTSATLTSPCKRRKREIPPENEIEDCSNQENSNDETFQDSYDINRYVLNLN